MSATPRGITVSRRRRSLLSCRASSEAVHELPAARRLWHPFDPTRSEAMLAELTQVGARTAVWPNETSCAWTRADTGERVGPRAAALLTDPGH
jgi:hypothetical protein